nr:immunoglobulin light chain junction region [Macaca mulatta]MOW18564.1 immunoglobulin light chain junction region [Macaca mulatta]MOW18700.1 immunoglobulin light chain junction region [Macaca mulatta]
DYYCSLYMGSGTLVLF